MKRLNMMWLVLAAGLLLTGCGPYVEGYYFSPNPGLVVVPPTQPTTQPSTDLPPVGVFVSVVGVRRADDREKLPESIEVHMRLENNSQQPVLFDPQTLDLNNEGLVSFGKPIAQPGELITIAPTESATFRAWFPFPPGRSVDNTDLGSLRLRWLVGVDGRTVGQGIHFHRVYRVYYEPYPYYGGYPYAGYGHFYGGVIIHRR